MRPHAKELLLNFSQEGTVGAQCFLLLEKTNPGIKFVQCTISLQARIRFGYPAATKERTATGITRFGVDLHGPDLG